MNKQQRYQRRMIADGRCLICGRVRDNHTLRCQRCRDAKRVSDRAWWARKREGAGRAA